MMSAIIILVLTSCRRGTEEQRTIMDIIKMKIEDNKTNKK